MHQRHDWVVPYFNDEMFAHKPPLMYWMMRTGFILFGVNEFAARFWSAAFGVATALLVYRIGKRMFNERVGLWAGLAMCTSLNLVLVDRAATPDSLLVFFCALALYLFARGEDWSDEPPAEAHSRSWQSWIGIYAAMGLAVLVKGPIGVLLPGATIGLYLLVRNRPENRAGDSTWEDRLISTVGRFSPARIVAAIWSMQPLVALAVVALVAGPWFVLVGMRTSGNFLIEFFGVQNYGRFMGSMDGHSGAIWYYIPAMLIGFFPWSIFAFSTASDLVRRSLARLPGQRPAKFVACWIVVFVGFFSIAGTKLPNYILPVYPALALATACYVDRWITNPASIRPLWIKLSFASLFLVGLATVIGTVVVSHQTASGQSLLEKWGSAPELNNEMTTVGLLGVALAIGAAVAFVLMAAQLRTATVGSLVATAAMFMLVAFSVVAIHIDRYQPCPAVASAISQHATGKPHVAQFGYFRPSLVYYTDGRVEACKSPQRVIDFLGQSSDSFLVTTTEQYARLSAQLPGDIVVLSRQTDFPRRGEVLLLGHKTDLAAHDQNTK